MSNGSSAGEKSVASIIDFDAEDAVSRALDTLAGGGVVAFPTDTVYALAASLAHFAALARLYQVKDRPLDKPIPVLLASASALANVARAVDATTGEFVAGFWPGPLTVILPARPDLPREVTGQDEQDRRTVAVRVPDHPLARDLITRAGGALAATSANTSGEAPGLTAADVMAQIGSRVDLILDGGRAPGGVASTVVALSPTGPRVLREGTVSANQLAARWIALTAPC